MQTAAMDWELAEINIARLKASVDDPALAGFMAALDPLNAAAEASPGFVWRLQTEDGNATAVQAFQWDTDGSAGVIVNLTVWASLDELAAYVYGDMHKQIMRRRREWFHLMREAYTTCWWVPAGHRPSTGEAEDRIRHLRAHGPTPHAFTLQASFPPPGGPDAAAGAGEAAGPSEAAAGRDEWLCPA
jgi:Domain of unknown function (DUF3291)